jgi:predicted nuclease of predicted toxin-antitoxin system
LAPDEADQPHSSDKAHGEGDESFAVLLDQNVPRSICQWLRQEHPSWRVWHAVEVGLAGKSDRQVYEWAQAAQALIVTFDEDVADQRAFPVGQHYGVVRLRVWPTTIEMTQFALGRLFEEFTEAELRGGLAIVDRTHIRMRHPQL